MAFLYKPSAFLLLTLFVSVQLLSLIEATNRRGGVTVDFIHRDSPRSPSYSPSKSHFERLQSSFQRSISRKSSLHRLSNLGKTSSLQEDIRAPITYGSGGEYYMKIAIGTPPVELLAIADTGSDLTWTQCTPCTSCYKQREPPFDPTKSVTYRAFSCQSQMCAQHGSFTCDSNNVCMYQYSYTDKSFTIGDVSAETLTFDSGLSFPGVVFGCGHRNGGTFSDFGSGIIGLGNGPFSIINQLANSIGGKFSYCLTSIESNATSRISLGADASVVGRDVLSTPLFQKSSDSYYHLALEGVSVDNIRVANSEASSVQEGNIIIDSGTTLTFLPLNLYNGLESALVASVKGTRVSSQLEIFKLCYEKDPDFSAPPVTLHFTGMDIKLTGDRTFVEVEQGVVCLTLVASKDLAFYGNLHQMNMLIGYDIEGKKLDFLPTDCSK